jgi:hypothetical protein
MESKRKTHDFYMNMSASLSQPLGNNKFKGKTYGDKVLWGGKQD